MGDVRSSRDLQVSPVPIAGNGQEESICTDTQHSNKKHSSEVEEESRNALQERIRATRTSGIPVIEKKIPNRKRYGVANMSASLSATSKGQSIPTAESLGVMMEKARIGETTFSEGYSSGRRISDDGNIVVKPLSIKRKTPPSLALEAVSTSPLQRETRLSNEGTPPNTPPHLTHSIYSDSNTDGDSLRSSFNSPAQAAHIARLLNFDQNAVPTIPLPPVNMYLKHRVPTDEALPQTVPATDRERGELNSQADPDSFVPAMACPMVAEPDIPGKMPYAFDRRPSASSTASSDIIDDGDDEDMQDFSLEDFPVPSVVLASPTTQGRFSESSERTVPNSPSTPRVSTLQPARNGLTAPVIGASPRSVQSIPTPRPDLFRINSSRTNAGQWDLAEEVRKEQLLESETLAEAFTV
jgi:hypothetical protein